MSTSSHVSSVQRCTYDSTQVIPPVGPSLFDASLFGNDRLRYDTGQHRECHCHSVIVIAVNVGTAPELVKRFTEDDDAVIELIGLDSEFACLWWK
jgi:hypothetical protein